MNKLNIIFLFILFSFISSKIINNRIALDSLFNIYKTGITNSHLFKEISNTTWKEYFISEKIKNLKKITPLHINSDKELDLFAQDHSDQLFWIDNIRGTSKDFTHKRLSNIFIGDFVVANKYDNEEENKGKNNNMFILATNQNKDRIIKYKKNPYYNPLITNDTLHNTKKYWEETIFLSITDSSFTSMLQITKYTKIKSLDLYKVKNGDYYILLLNLENVHSHSCKLIKIRIKEEKIISIDGIGTELKNINIIGLFDMNNDGLIDILYMDSKNILYVYLNQDPYYYSIEINKLNPTKIDNSPRLFVFDANKDIYPDIITGDTKKNTISLLVNPGRNYWNKIIDFYDNKDPDKSEIYKNITWQNVPLISDSESIFGEIKDFTIIMIDKSKRLSFEIVGIFGNKVYWFIEKDNNNNALLSKQSSNNLIHSMIKCEIFIEKLKGVDIKNDYDIILDIDLNKDLYPEFILYSYKLENMIYIQRKEIILTEYGWSQAFWIYLMIGIYTISTIIGGIEFFRLKNANDKFSMKISTSLINNEEYKKSKNIELSQVNNNKIL